MCQAAERALTEEALNGWLNEQALVEEETPEAIAVEGKTLKGGRDPQGHPSHLLSVCLHPCGVTIAQCGVHKTRFRHYGLCWSPCP